MFLTLVAVVFFREVMKKLVARGHSRVPIYDGDKRNLVGVLLVVMPTSFGFSRANVVVLDVVKVQIETHCTIDLFLGGFSLVLLSKSACRLRAS